MGRFNMAIQSLRYRNPQRQSIFVDVGDEYELRVLGRLRSIFISGSSQLRCHLTGTVAVTGCMWLLNTPRIEDLLLNCAALTVIFDVDEIIFRVLMPLEAVQFVSSLKPLTLPVCSSRLSLASCFTSGLMAWVITLGAMAGCIVVLI